jgi:hypothetical protein
MGSLAKGRFTNWARLRLDYERMTGERTGLVKQQTNKFDRGDGKGLCRQRYVGNAMETRDPLFSS